MGNESLHSIDLTLNPSKRSFRKSNSRKKDFCQQFFSRYRYQNRSVNNLLFCAFYFEWKLQFLWMIYHFYLWKTCLIDNCFALIQGMYIFIKIYIFCNLLEIALYSINVVYAWSGLIFHKIWHSYVPFEQG